VFEDTEFPVQDDSAADAGADGQRYEVVTTGTGAGPGFAG
jgi:hypothetical protein